MMILVLLFAVQPLFRVQPTSYNELLFKYPLQSKQLL